MWHIKDFEIRKTTLDFSSSEQGKPEVSQLVYEDIVLMNAIEYLEFDEDSVQVIICDHCGTVNCASSNWVCFRKSGDYILLIPDFESIEEDSWSATEYSPPTYWDKSDHNKRKGTPYFDLETYEKLRISFPKFLSTEQIENLKMSEALRLVQYSFPFKFFGEPPEIFVQPNKWNLAVGASVGEVKEYLQKIEQMLKDNYENETSALIRKPLPNENVIYIFLMLMNLLIGKR